MITDDYISTIIESYTVLVGEIPKVYVSYEVYSNLKCKMNVEVERFLRGDYLYLSSENYEGFISDNKLHYYKKFKWDTWKPVSWYIGD